MLREIFNKETISIMKLLTLNWIGYKLDICPDKNIFVCNRLGGKKTPEILILVKAKHCFYFFGWFGAHQSHLDGQSYGKKRGHWDTWAVLLALSLYGSEFFGLYVGERATQNHLSKKEVSCLSNLDVQGSVQPQVSQSCKLCHQSFLSLHPSTVLLCLSQTPHGSCVSSGLIFSQVLDQNESAENLPSSPKVHSEWTSLRSEISQDLEPFAAMPGQTFTQATEYKETVD